MEARHQAAEKQKNGSQGAISDYINVRRFYDTYFVCYASQMCNAHVLLA